MKPERLPEQFGRVGHEWVLASGRLHGGLYERVDATIGKPAVFPILERRSCSGVEETIGVATTDDQWLFANGLARSQGGEGARAGSDGVKMLSQTGLSSGGLL